MRSAGVGGPRTSAVDAGAAVESVECGACVTAGGLVRRVPASRRVHYRVHIASARAARIITLQFPFDASIESVRLQGDVRPQVAASPQRLAHGESQLRLFSVSPQGQDLSFDAAESGFDLVVLDQSFGLPGEGDALRRARGELAVPSREGDATIVRRSFRLQP